MRVLDAIRHRFGLGFGRSPSPPSSLTIAPLEKVAALHGLYYVTSGIWPIVDLPSFEAVSGRKRDRWLVRTMGAVFVAVGASLVTAAARRKVDTPTQVLGVGVPIAVTAAELYYVGRRRIPR